MEWIDDITRGWASEYPDLDLSSLPPLVRVARLGVLIEAFQHDVLEPFGLSPSDYGVLATLRRSGPPYALNPSQLYSLLRRSSGGMTKILKRLEQAELVERTPDPEDGRGSRVSLTARGLSLQDRVFLAFVTASGIQYGQIAAAVDGVVDEISVEDSHRHNPPEMFELFSQSRLIVGFVAIASSRLESVEEIVSRMREVLKHVPAERLIAAPDCGLGFLGRDLAMAKLKNLCAAAAVA